MARVLGDWDAIVDEAIALHGDTEVSRGYAVRIYQQEQQYQGFWLLEEKAEHE